MKCPTVSCFVGLRIICRLILGLTLTFSLEEVNDEPDTIASEVSITDCTIGDLEFQPVYFIIFKLIR